MCIPVNWSRISVSFSTYNVRIDGHIETVASMHANSVQGKNVGYLKMTYENTKASHIYMMVPGLFTGTAFGDRVFNLSGKGYCLDMVNYLLSNKIG